MRHSGNSLPTKDSLWKPIARFDILVQTPLATEQAMRTKFGLILIFALSLVVAACGGGDSDTTTTTAAVAADTTTTTQTATAATTTTTGVVTTTSQAALSESMAVEVDGQSRSYLLFVPSGHDITDPAPLVINSHGGQGTPERQVASSRFNETAETEGIVVAYPGAIGGVWDLSGDSDVDFISALIDDVSQIVAIDPSRIYAIGFSQGAGITALLACRIPERIAAVATVASVHHNDAPACPEPQPARLLGIVGATDPITNSGFTISDPRIPDPPGPMTEEAAAWATTNSCGSTPEEDSLTGEITYLQYSCEEDAALEIYIHPGGHIWPTETVPGIETNKMIWDFLSQYSRLTTP